MEIKELTRRAMELRGRFAELQQQQLRREWTKEDIMLGLVVDIGDLTRLVMAKSGARDVADVDRRLAHELSDCLWSILVLSRLYGLDLEKEFLETMAGIDDSITEKLRVLNQSPETASSVPAPAAEPPPRQP